MKIDVSIYSNDGSADAQRDYASGLLHRALAATSFGRRILLLLLIIMLIIIISKRMGDVTGMHM
jgi:hypothetical protein